MATPFELGYRMPAEWEPHAATWLSWPHNRDTWPGSFEPVPLIWTELARAIAQYEPVNILAAGAVLEDAKRRVGDVPHVTLHPFVTNDAWMRDHGPTFLAGPSGAPPAIVNWQYNAWGGKYPPFDADNLVAPQIAEMLGRKVFSPGIVMEGGAIDVNGQGTVLTTEQCLLNPNRNPNLSRAEVEKYLRDYLATPNVLWLGGGIEGDDTDGHIDELARFVNPTTVVAAVERDPADVNFKPLDDNLQRLRRMKDQDGRALEVIEMPMPGAVFHGDHRLPASYLNFYIANGLVVVPTFDDPMDDPAMELIARLFPGRRVHGQRAVDLLWGLGTFHCITQQQPA